MSQAARKHHYLPQGYLAAFTDTGHKSGKLYVFDVSNGTRFRTSPKNVAAERDFNRVNLENVSADCIEKAWSPFEGRAVKAIRNVIRTEQFPDQENYNDILNLLCLIAVRNPRLRRSYNRFLSQVYQKIAGVLASDKEIYEYHLKKAQESGDVARRDVSFEEMKRFIEGGRYRIEVPKEANLEAEVRAFDGLFPLLGRRMWSVLVAPKSGPNFISCDHPVVLAWKNPDSRRPIGYGMQNTEVFLPLASRIGFYGVYEDHLDPTVKIKSAAVAMMNRWVTENADRHVFSSEGTLVLESAPA